MPWALSLIREFTHELDAQLGYPEPVLAPLRGLLGAAAPPYDGELATAFAFVDWAVRDVAPVLFRTHGRPDVALQLCQLDEVRDFASAVAARELCAVLPPASPDDREALDFLVHATATALWADAASAVAAGRAHPLGRLVAREARGMSIGDARDVGHAEQVAGILASFVAATLRRVKSEPAINDALRAFAARFAVS